MADERDAEGQGEDGADVREQDQLLPIANIGRIMKGVVPSSAKISKDAKETVQECVSEFISFVTSEANEKCIQEKRKTINGDDLIWAMRNLGFDDYVEPLTVYLNRYKDSTSAEVAGDMRSSLRRKRDSGDQGDDLQDGGMMPGQPAFAPGAQVPFRGPGGPVPYGAMDDGTGNGVRPCGSAEQMADMAAAGHGMA